MQVISLTEARNNLKDVFDSVYLNHEEVVIHRKGRALKHAREGKVFTKELIEP